MDIIKTVGSSGQITLGKKFAGQSVLLTEMDKGVWLLKVGRFIPDNEKWIHHSQVQQELDKAIDWAENNPPEETDLENLKARIK
ncbi:hypothetical protein [Desulfotignum balticum]|jgi:hypothetical protein|uniref:hypothetical protein n=1 Tax=Desulfotignum balticum TaxID=115781 RepID=UPI000416AC4F|nr:hypothetical protein [Desulfotignum balticum]